MFLFKQEITFRDFLGIFSLKGTIDMSQTDIKNSFKLISQEYDPMNSGKIHIDTLRSCLAEDDMSDVEVMHITKQLAPQCDDNGMIDYEALLKAAY